MSLEAARWRRPTEGVPHSGDGASVQVQRVCEVGQHHGQVGAPVPPLLLPAALNEFETRVSGGGNECTQLVRLLRKQMMKNSKG